MLRRSLIALGGICLLIAGAALYYWNDIRLDRAATGDLVQQASQRYGRHVTLRDMPSQWISILLAIEDPTFREHRGVDLTTPGAGMTTITQGLVKLLYFPDGFKPGISKIRQTLIAQYALNELLPKDDQLELYLNATYFGAVDGNPIHGIERAAKQYFGKSYRDLAEDEFIALIGMTISPNEFKPSTAKSVERVERIKKYLSGQVKPASVLDVEYLGKQRGTFLEEALMAFLRLITDAAPLADGRGVKRS